MENWDLTTSKSRQRYVHYFAIQHLFSTLSLLLFLGGEVAWNALNKNKNDFCRIPLLEEEPCLPHHVATETWGSYTHAHPWIQNTNTPIHKYMFPMVMHYFYQAHCISVHICQCMVQLWHWWPNHRCKWFPHLASFKGERWSSSRWLDTLCQSTQLCGESKRKKGASLRFDRQEVKALLSTWPNLKSLQIHTCVCFGVLTSLVGIDEGYVFVLVVIVVVLEEGVVGGNLVGKHSHSFGCQIVGG